jgi:homoserine kinase
MRKPFPGNSTFRGVVIHRVDRSSIKAGFVAQCDTCDEQLAGRTQRDAWLQHQRHLRVHMTFENRVKAAARELQALAWDLGAGDDREVLAILDTAAAAFRHLLEVEQPHRAAAIVSMSEVP